MNIRLEPRIRIERIAFIAVIVMGTLLIMAIFATQTPPEYLLAVAAGTGTLLGAYTFFNYHPALRKGEASDFARDLADRVVRWIGL